MTNEERKEKITAIEKLLKELKEENTEGERENKSKRWGAERGLDYYFVIKNNEIINALKKNTRFDNYRYDSHNYFENKKEVEKYIRVLKTERQLIKFADEHNDKINWDDTNQVKYFMGYDYICHNIYVSGCHTFKVARVIYFSSKEIAEQAIDEIGRNDIIKYLTYNY